MLSNSQKPFVSVIIPCFNREAFVGDAIRSALSQSVSDIEIIVVDDGSTDRSAEIAVTFGSRVRLLRQSNGGPAAARNTGLRSARGQYIAFLDSDDVWLPSKLERQLQFIQDNPRCAIVHNTVKWNRDYPPDTGKGDYYPRLQDDWGSLFRGGVIHTSCVLIPADITQRIGLFLERLRYWEDLNYWLRAALHGSVGLVDDQLTVRRRGGYSDGNSQVPMQWVYWYRAYWHALRGARSIISDDEYVACREYMGEQVAHHLVGAYWHHNRTALRGLLFPALLHGPLRLKAMLYFWASLLPASARDYMETLLGHPRPDKCNDTR